MGVDYYTCNYCGETFPDCGSYVYCGECYTRWCCDECAEKEGFKYNNEEEGDMEYSTCSFCREEDAKDEDLLSFCLLKMGLSHQQLVEQYYQESK